jgi:hypothetical protein
MLSTDHLLLGAVAQKDKSACMIERICECEFTDRYVCRRKWPERTKNRTSKSSLSETGSFLCTVALYWTCIWQSPFLFTRLFRSFSGSVIAPYFLFSRTGPSLFCRYENLFLTPFYRPFNQSFGLSFLPLLFLARSTLVRHTRVDSGSRPFRFLWKRCKPAKDSCYILLIPLTR